MSITPSHHCVIYLTDETLEEANIRLNRVVSEHMGTIVQLRREISSLRGIIDQYEAKIDNLRGMVSTKMEPLACVEEGPVSDEGELHLCTCDL